MCIINVGRDFNCNLVLCLLMNYNCPPYNNVSHIPDIDQFPDGMKNQESGIRSVECGIPTPIRENERGEASSICRHPWSAQLIIELDRRRIRYCSGSIINSRYVLTAAHCCLTKPSSMVAVIGQSERVKNRNETLRAETCNIFSKIMEVESFWVHPSFTVKIWKINNIALVRLKEEIEFSGVLRPICLPLDGDNIKENEVLITSSWLSTIYNESYITEESLEQVPVRIWSQPVCNYYVSKGTVRGEHSYICVNSTLEEEEGLRRPIEGGASLLKQNAEGLQRWVLVGVQSHSSGGESNVPNIYTRVYSYVSWIIKQTST